MKLAEALAMRADIQKRLAQIASRAVAQARHQEGEEPAEDPDDLLAEHARLSDQLEQLIVRINEQNLHTRIASGASMTAALARRDVLTQRYRCVSDVADAAAIPMDRYTRTEIRSVSSVNVRERRQEADALAMELRDLDTQIQHANWVTEIDL